MADEKHGAEEWVIKFIQEHGLTWVALIIAAFCALVFGVAWVWSRKLALQSAELANRKAKKELLDGLTETRDKFHADQETFNLAMIRMAETIAAFKAEKISQDDLRNCRNEMCRLFEQAFMASLVKYIEQIAVVEPGDSERVKNEIFPALKQMQRFYDLVNKPMLDLLPNAGAPLQMRTEQRDGLFDKVANCIPNKTEWLTELETMRRRTDAYIRPD